MPLLLVLSSGFDKAGIYLVSDIANEYLIYHFCIIIKDSFISFSRVISIPGFKTVVVNVLLLCKLTFPVVFC